MRQRTGGMRRALAARIGVVALVASLLVTAGAGAPAAQAANGGDFNPGSIISDQKFHDAQAMNEAQIRSFLQSKVGSCAAGSTCMLDYRQDTWTRAADAQCSTYPGAAGEPSSRIIAKVATACGINPQVLLVLLEKEQSLVTLRSPSAARFAKATGFACPDTAPCNAEFAGFYNQVYKAAWQYRYYENNPGRYRYKANAVNTIQWHPDAACGTSQVYIENQATANLYIYTPYAPNPAALANMYGLGDGCSSYGNRNFWRIFSDWFGAPSGPPLPHGSLDSARGVLGGIQISGWAVDLFSNESTYVWVTVDGAGRPLIADTERGWIGAMYPGKGTRHGFDATISAGPGQHRICVQQATNSRVVGCADVTVPSSTRAAGAVDSVTSSAAGIRVQGWSVDKTSAGPLYVWINVNGQGRAYRVDKKLSWTPGMFPGVGNTHGFDVTIPAEAGAKEVCVHGVDSVLLRCAVTTVPRAETGKVETAAGVPGGVRVSGWSLDTRTSASTYVWITVDGKGVAAKADRDSAAAAAAHPGLGGRHGFDETIAAPPGDRRVCVTGTAQSTSYGCQTVRVPNNEVGSFDTAAGVPGGIDVAGWSLLRGQRTATYVWVDVDGVGRAVRANQHLSWIDGYFGGTVGPDHGFRTTVPATPGTHRVCITGTTENVSYGCKDVTVPARVAGNADSVVAADGGIRVTGWAVDRDSAKSLYVWVDVDGQGQAVAANLDLSWIDRMYPGVGPRHGFDAVVAAPAGSHRVCLTVTEGSLPLGCTTVVVS